MSGKLLFSLEGISDISIKLNSLFFASLFVFHASFTCDHTYLVESVKLVVTGGCFFAF